MTLPSDAAIGCALLTIFLVAALVFVVGLVWGFGVSGGAMNQEKREALQELGRIENDNRRRQWWSIVWAAIAGASAIWHSTRVGEDEGAYHDIMLWVWLILFAVWSWIFFAQGKIARDCRRDIEKWGRLP